VASSSHPAVDAHGPADFAVSGFRDAIDACALRDLDADLQLSPEEVLRCATDVSSRPRLDAVALAADHLLWVDADLAEVAAVSLADPVASKLSLLGPNMLLGLGAQLRALDVATAPDRCAG
jgi:hypothetical protein